MESEVFIRDRKIEHLKTDLLKTECTERALKQHLTERQRQIEGLKAELVEAQINSRFFEKDMADTAAQTEHPLVKS